MNSHHSLVLNAFLIFAAFANHAIGQARCEAADHGMRGDGSDNVAALTKVLAECAGQTIHISHGTYSFKPSGFAVGIQIPANTRLSGDGVQGSQATVMQIANTGNFQALLWIRNVSNVAVRGIRFEGTSYTSGCNKGLDYGHAIYIQSDAGQSAAIDQMELIGNSFHNFNGMSWISFNAMEGSPGIGVNGAVKIWNNVFDSDANLAGSCYATGGITYMASMISLHGSNYSDRGLVANVDIESNTFNSAYIKSAVATWSGTRSVAISRNEIRDSGLRLPPAAGTELGRYAILIYNSAHDNVRDFSGLHPENIDVSDNTITNPVSCGVYVAKGRNVRILRNRISGQTDRFDGTLPKGAISLNHAEGAVVRDNELTDNYIGLSSVAGEITVGENRIAAPAAGIREKIIR